jgi:hypothetical protein
MREIPVPGLVVEAGELQVLKHFDLARLSYSARTTLRSQLRDTTVSVVDARTGNI